MMIKLESLFSDVTYLRTKALRVALLDNDRVTGSPPSLLHTHTHTHMNSFLLMLSSDDVIGVGFLSRPNGKRPNKRV